MTKKYKNKYGAVSLYVVIFSAILITIITVGFIAVMVRNQRQATNNDLSRSAYDSALAGVEDGKRSILRYLNCIKTPGDTGCAAVIANMSASDDGCTDIVAGLDGVNVSDGEVAIDSTSSNNFQQAYTCVKVTIDTDDYIDELSKNESKLVPLIGLEKFDTIRLDWFIKSDLPPGETIQIDSPTATTLYDNWGNRPPIMRANYFYSDKNNFNLSDFDINGNNSKTLFLYPNKYGSGSISSFAFSEDIRNASTPRYTKPAHCELDYDLDLVGNGYACSTKLRLPVAIDSNKVAFVYLTSLYNKTTYKISLMDSTAADKIVKFDGVQPEIDSTGRANDLFRRIKTRVELVNPNYPYPQAAVDIDSTGNFCKAFQITDKLTNYANSCTP